MKKIIFFLCLFFVSIDILRAQGCPGVTVEVYSNGQGGSHNYFGARATIATPSQDADITIIGIIREEGGGASVPFTLVILKGEVTAETGANAFQTCPACNAEVMVTSVTPCPNSSGFNMTTALSDFINQKITAMNVAGDNIYALVDAYTSDVTKHGDGALIFPNYVRLADIGQGIDSLNTLWDVLYASTMNEIVDYAFSTGAATGENNFQTRENVWDIIEENYFSIAESKATLCLEQKFSFSSLHLQVEANENAWLEAGNSDMSQNPSLNQNLPEEFWSLVTPASNMHITNVNLANQLTNEQDTVRAKSILEKIKEIVEILGLLLDGLEQLGNLMKDCSGSTEAKVRKVRDGIKFENDNRMIGYEMEQKSITFDFNSSETKIKGKAKLFKKKNNGKYKKDKKNNVGISFCAKEWNACESRNWPSDGLPYFHPVATAKKKVKTYIHQPYALAIDESIHFLQFRVFGLDQFVGAVNLLGVYGCD